MKYMLMMHAPRGSENGEYQVGSWSPQDFQAHIAFMHQFNAQLTAAGELVAAQGLSMPGEARLVRAGADGAPVTDGPFPETKEFLAGYWIVDVADAQRAYALAAQVSAAPGPGGAPLRMPIEVRPIMSGPPQDA